MDECGRSFEMLKGKRLFYCLSLLGFAVSFFLIMETDGEALKPFFYYYKDYCMDFFSHILFVRDRQHVYESSVFATFPPFAYLIYYVLGKFIPSSAVNDPGGSGLRDNLLGMNLYVTYMVVLVLIFSYVLQYFMKERRRGEQLGLSLLILLSAPFIGLYERGNSVFLVLILLFCFVALERSESAVKREAALLCLAAAAALKLYPAVFGLLYLKQRRWEEAARLTLYGLFLVFAPFVFFGGWSQIPVLLYNFKFITEGFILGGDLRSVAYATIWIGERFGGEVSALFALGEKLAYVFFAASCLCVLFQKTLWKQLVLLAGIMIFFPSWSGSYTIVYMTLPFVLFMTGWGEHDVRKQEREEREGEKTAAAGEYREGAFREAAYQICFACVFTMMLWNPEWSQRIFRSEFSYTIRVLGTWGLVLLVMADTVWERMIGRKKK